MIKENNPAYRHGFATRTDGKIKEYHIWIAMRQRCRNPKNKDYKDYGGRGIKICKRWDSFKAFILDMGYAPTTKHSIDRIDNNGNYQPSNCKWSTNKFQCNHTRRNVFLTHKGETKTLSQWSELLKIGYSTLHARYYKLKWPADMVLTTPLR